MCRRSKLCSLMFIDCIWNYFSKEISMSSSALMCIITKFFWTIEILLKIKYLHLLHILLYRMLSILFIVITYNYFYKKISHYVLWKSILFFCVAIFISILHALSTSNKNIECLINSRVLLSVQKHNNNKSNISYHHHY